MTFDSGINAADVIGAIASMVYPYLVLGIILWLSLLARAFMRRGAVYSYMSAAWAGIGGLKVGNFGNPGSGGGTTAGSGGGGSTGGDGSSTGGTEEEGDGGSKGGTGL